MFQRECLQFQKEDVFKSLEVLKERFEGAVRVQHLQLFEYLMFLFKCTQLQQDHIQGTSSSFAADYELYENIII